MYYIKLPKASTVSSNLILWVLSKFKLFSQEFAAVLDIETNSAAATFIASAVIKNRVDYKLVKILFIKLTLAFINSISKIVPVTK